MSIKVQLAPGLQLHLGAVLMRHRDIIGDGSKPGYQSSNTKLIVSLGRTVVDEADAGFLERFSIIPSNTSTGQKDKETRMRFSIVNSLYPRWRL